MTAPTTARRRLAAPLTAREARDLAKGLLFISPWLAGFVAFVAYPIAASLYYSFTDYDLLRPPVFVGLANYADLAQDELIGRVLYNTLYFVVLGVPAGVVVAFLLASLLNQRLRARALFRTVFFVPSIVPAVAAAMIWLWIYNTQYGVISSVLRGVGVQAVPFLSNQYLAKPSLILIHCWGSGAAMLIFLAALQDVPQALYEAAKVDGASAWQRFRNVTVPMCTPAILFNLLTGMIGAFQYFTFAWLLTQGGPNGATEFYALYLYRNAFSFLKMGYASALAWGLFLLTLVLTIALFRSSARWVYYGGATE
jgi:multiple sugar transport system permease protein